MNDKIKAMSNEERLDKIKKNAETSDWKLEMKRLRNKMGVENLFPFLPYFPDLFTFNQQQIAQKQQQNEFNDSSTLNIMYLNLPHFLKHRGKVHNDYGFRAAHVQLFVETHMDLEKANQSTVDILPGRTIKYLSGCRDKNSSYGQLCFIKNDRVENIWRIAQNGDENCEYNTTDTSEFSLFKYLFEGSNEKIFICLVYRHPKHDIQEFLHDFYDFYVDNFFNNSVENPKRAARCLVFGDFNIDFNNKSKKVQDILINVLDDKMHLTPIFTNKPTHNKGNQLDWIFTNNKDLKKYTVDTKVYETWFSDHKPLWCQIKLIG